MQSVQNGDITEALHIRIVGIATSLVNLVLPYFFLPAIRINQTDTIMSDAPSKLMEAFHEGGLSDFSEHGVLLMILAGALPILVNMMVV